MLKTHISDKNETVRMFKSGFMEFFSHSHPLIPALLYLPVVGFMFYLSFAKEHFPIFAVGGLFLVGLVAWTLLEYFIHRYVFHHRSPSQWSDRFHFIVHGSHHDYP